MSEGKGAFRYALSAGEAAGGVLSLANPEGADLIVTRLILDVTTPATAACTVDAGIAANGTTSSDNLINGLDVNTAAGVFDNLEDKGVNGKARQKWSSSEYLTISKASGAAAGLAGYAYVEYVRV